MSTNLPTALWPLVQRRRDEEAPEPEAQALIRGADGVPRLVSARFLARMDATCEILKAAGIKVTALPVQLDGEPYPDFN